MLGALCAHWNRVVRKSKYNNMTLSSLATSVFGALTASSAEVHHVNDKEVIMDAILNQRLLPSIETIIDRHESIFDQ